MDPVKKGIQAKMRRYHGLRGLERLADQSSQDQEACLELQARDKIRVQDDLSQEEDQVLVHPARGGSVAICSGILANRFTTLKKQKDIYFGWS